MPTDKIVVPIRKNSSTTQSKYISDSGGSGTDGGGGMGGGGDMLREKVAALEVHVGNINQRLEGIDEKLTWHFRGGMGAAVAVILACWALNTYFFDKVDAKIDGINSKISSDNVNVVQKISDLDKSISLQINDLSHSLKEKK